MLSHTLYGIALEVINTSSSHYKADAETGQRDRLYMAKTRGRLSSLLNQAMNEK